MSARYEQSTSTSKDCSGKKEIKLHLRLDHHHKKAYAAIKEVCAVQMVVESIRNKTGNAEVVAK